MMMKLTVSKVDIFLLIFTMLSISMPHTLYLVLRYMILAYLFLKYIRLYSKKNSLIYVFILGYGAVLLFSTLQNNMRINYIISAFSYVIQIIDTYLLISSLKKSLQFKARTIFRVLLVLAIITDALIIILPYDTSAPAVQYFVGTKFTVSYLHCLLVCLFDYYAVNWGVKHKSAYYVLLIGSVFVTRIVKCSTGTIMCGIILILHFVPRKMWRVLCSWKAVAIVSAVMMLLLFGEMTVLNNENFISTVARIFNKNVNLTGRTYIYRYLPIVIIKKPYIGYGYYNTIVADYMGTVGANPQNGFMKIIVDSGFLGLVFYIGFMILSIRKGTKHYEKKYPLFIYFYAMLLVSSIEITLTGGLFFLIMALIYASSNTEDNRELEGVKVKYKRNPRVV